MTPKTDVSSMRPKALQKLFAAAAGAFLGLAMVKFGNPAILDSLVTPPEDVWQLLFMAWPLRWGYGFLAAVTALGLLLWRFRWPTPKWPVVLPLIWFGCQLLSAAGTADARLSAPTLLYFTALVTGFYLSLFALAGVSDLRPFWAGLVAGFLVMAWTGFEQHFGGLESTRRYIYAQPGWENLDPEHLKRIASDRIFGTLLYPNSLAGVVLLLLPAVGVAVWQITNPLPRVARLVLTGLAAYLGLACLYWSGSKAGWLIALFLVLTGLMHVRFDRRTKLAIVGTLIVLGLTGFFVRYADYFARGATSVSARFGYWNAAWITFTRQPLLGSGPGTFAVKYREIKPPEAEMTRLVHNDYLQQASDSGLPGAAVYLGFIATSLVALHRGSRRDPLRFGVWIGLLGWALQSLVEFGLYIPAIGWTAFWLLGWLWGTNGMDKSARNP